ncbi:uncharacterized protein Z519_06542 [Cladophialophora bantiana CBS 173.52]|uniref:SHSP domain-containing protein n=1 Tax=Cladophialophora bantiana (strain ATCC 10958 / CBS 173.52 / CDC B-1940 / NIH 8579) TaxID=1442370 RepID=A0A0D2HPC3_CLAB1|nr:uncharacterized protein Z519_06542 [Cladophialophora bantiana CBS 173.52]KIW92695.1 hypothetical protein Z519_06542 [Cladophialophora bantiana CBS 173.52]
MSPLNLNTVLKPPHVTFDSHGPYHRGSIRSVFDYLGGGEIDSVFNQKHHHRQPHSVFEEGVVFPNFTVRETAEAYFLEGDFPGIHNPNDIKIERLGSQGLLVEAQAPALGLYGEWGNAFGLRPSKETQVERGASESTTVTAEGGGESGGAKPKPIEMRTRSPGHEHERAEAGAAAEGEKLRSSGGDNEGSKSTTVERRPHKLHRRGSSSADDEDGAAPTTLLQERHVGRFLRSFTFPQTVDLDHMKARLKDGVLRIALPKTSVRERRSSFKIEYGG